MTRRIRGAWALAAGLCLAAQAGAASAQTWWTCGVEVPLSRSVGMRMTMVGPALRHDGVDNLFIASFQTTDPYETAAELKSPVYDAAFVAFLTKSGYPVTSAIADEDIASVCFPTATAAEAQAKRAEFMETTDSGGGSVRMTMNSMDVSWSPVAAPAPAPAPSVTAPAVAPAPGTSPIGVRTAPVTAETAQLLGLAAVQGVAVIEVVAGSPAAKAGLQRTDVIVEFVGQAINSSAELTSIAGRVRPGFDAPMRIWRAGALKDISVRIGDAAEPSAPAPAPAKTADAAPGPAPKAAEAKPLLKGLDALAPQVRVAVEAARKVEAQSRAKAAEAEALASQARMVAAQAQDAAAKAEQKVQGYGKTRGRFSTDGGYSWAYRYAGQVTDGVATGLGVTVVPETNQVFAGQNFLKRATMGGLGVGDYPGWYHSEGDWRADGLRVRTWATGVRYAGEFSDNQPSGFGMLYPEPSSGIAEISATVGGYGVMVRKDGRRTEGQGTAKTFEGLAAEFAADGSVIGQGVYAAGRLVTPLAGPGE